MKALESRIDGVKLSYVQQALIHEEKKRREQPTEALPSSLTNSALLGTHVPRRRDYLEEQSDVMDVVGWDTLAVSAVRRKGAVTTWNQRTKPRLR